jgi:hypothetical protein
MLRVWLCFKTSVTEADTEKLDRRIIFIGRTEPVWIGKSRHSTKRNKMLYDIIIYWHLLTWFYTRSIWSLCTRSLPFLWTFLPKLGGFALLLWHLTFRMCSYAMESYQNQLYVCVCLYMYVQIMILGFARDACPTNPCWDGCWALNNIRRTGERNVSWNCKTWIHIATYE